MQNRIPKIQFEQFLQAVGNVENSFLIIILSFSFITLIGLVNYLTSSKFSFSILYGIPILLIAISKNSTLNTRTRKVMLVATSLFISFVWFLVNFYNNKLNVSMHIINALVRFSFFVFSGLIILDIKVAYKKQIHYKELLKVKDALEESVRLKDAFLANMSHEIRTPMNVIICYSNLLSNKKFSEQEMEYIRTIKMAGENLLKIINDILDISKIEAGMIVFEEHPFSVREIFNSINLLLAEKAKEKEIKLIFHCDEQVPNVLLGDSMRLTQILINLAGNAIKFTKNCKNKKGMVFVNAKVTKDEEEIILVEFSVKDNGIGIPADKLEHVFERFRQADSATTRKYGGTGLGLSIAKQLVELQKGQMTVKSKFKMGSVFTFCIPFKKSSLTQLIPEVTKMEYNIEDLRKLKILMVEDNPLNILLMTNLFSENNLKMEVAKNGVEGIERLKENNIDIILMDMEMPVMNGYEATGIIRNKMKNNVPIIAMTANAMAGERDKCLRLGMNDYISKPIDSKLLFNTMYNLTIKT